MEEKASERLRNSPVSVVVNIRNNVGKATAFLLAISGSLFSFMILIREGKVENAFSSHLFVEALVRSKEGSTNSIGSLR